MSTSAPRRTRDRALATKVTAPTKPSRTLTPTSNKFPATENAASKRISSSAGKENPRSISRGPASQKPSGIKQMPRVVDSNASAESRKRWSTSSSVPRGRSPSPSNISRYLSDLKNNSNSNNKSQNVRNDSVKVLEKKELKGSNFGDGGRVLSHSRKENTLSVERRNEKGYLRSKSKNAVVVENNLIDLKEKLMNVVGSTKDVNEKSSREMVSKSIESVTEKERREEGVGSGAMVGVKYPSKLHEKLAFLEGKVKRIACDIKRTKEILDMNNPDASKVIISDIQDKISGIEKAMGRVSSSTEGDLIENEKKSKLVEVDLEEAAENVLGKVKGMNSEELEARLFPHHRLLRDRTTLKSLMVKSESQEASLEESSGVTTVEDKLLSLPDEVKPIALEFVKSLNPEHPKVTMRNMCAGMELSEVQDMDGGVSSNMCDSSVVLGEKQDVEITLTSDETLDEFDDQENRQEMVIREDIEDTCMYELNDIGQKTSTGGWFVSEGESILLAHNDSSCTYYDIANCEEKAEYRPPDGVAPNLWRDCWVVRAPGADGCSGRYVVAASAGNTMDAGFCSWDFYSRDVHAFHIEDGVASCRTVLGPLPNNVMPRRNTLSTLLPTENRQWWYKPCGPLIISAASSQRGVKVYDIRDGEQVMKWDVLKPVLTMDYSSPLQWRSKGKVVIAESENISLWDVTSLNPQSLLSVSSNGRKVTALHVNNTDAEIGGGVRQRVSSSEAEGNDGVFCTADFINTLDFRLPSGVGLKIPKIGVHAQSVFSRGDSVFLGCTNLRSVGKKQSSSQVEQFSIRAQKLISSYVLPESNAHSHHAAITQVWGNSNLVMAICGLGLFVFDAFKDDGLQSFASDHNSHQKVRETIGPDDMYAPSFDYLSSRALLISRDRPASWRHLI